MNIKLPACYDVSHWKEIPDFNLVNPKPILFITKASEGTSLIDDKFIRFAEGFMSIGCIRGFYHFNRKALDPYKQAHHFLSVISKIDILKTDRLILDVEEGGETASQLWAWFETVRRFGPDNELLLYSRKNILDLIRMTITEKDYFKKIKVWTAGYPYFPDLYNSIPSGYIPDQSKYGECVLWQYSSHGKVTGIVGDTDLNFIKPEYASTLGSNEASGVTMATYKGVCTQLAKVWSSIGGAQISEVKVNQSITGDSETIVSGTKYIHLTSPINGWSKAQWFNYSIVTEPPPPPPPSTVTLKHTIEVYSDGSLKVDGNSYP